MKRINPDIIGKYELMTELITSVKITNEKTMLLVPSKSRSDWKDSSSATICKSNNQELELYVKKKVHSESYRIFLKCSSITHEPFIKFDSDGASHRNHIDDIPLDKQLVTTPHFNTFNKDGLSIAYKNEDLENEQNAKHIVGDVNIGMPFFCTHVNCVLESGSYPHVEDKVQELEFFKEDSEIINIDDIIFE